MIIGHNGKEVSVRALILKKHPMSKIPTSGVKAHPDGNEYLSDVNTHNSDINYRSDSEVSADFVASAKTLEHGFRYKFRILRQAYEDRLVNLSQIVETSCGALISEEIGHEMRNDATTLGYLPAHLAEVFNSHLHDEREAFLAETLKRLKTLELQASRKDEIVDETLAKMEKMEAEMNACRHRELEVEPMRYRLTELEQQLHVLQRESKAEAAELTQKNEALRRENQQLSASLTEMRSVLEVHSSQKDAHQSDLLLTKNEFAEMEKHCHRYVIYCTDALT